MELGCNIFDGFFAQIGGPDTGFLSCCVIASLVLRRALLWHAMITEMVMVATITIRNAQIQLYARSKRNYTSKGSGIDMNEFYGICFTYIESQSSLRPALPSPSTTSFPIPTTSLLTSRPENPHSPFSAPVKSEPVFKLLNVAGKR